MGWFQRQFGKVGRAVGNTVTSAEEGLGLIDHKTAKAAHTVGDHVAADYGVHVEEKQLGETKDPSELVHGNPAKLAEVEQVLTDYAKSYEQIGEGVRGIDTHDWTGESADKFRQARDQHAKDWHKGADAYEQAAAAVNAHSHTVTWGQRQAKEAIALWEKAEQEAKQAAEHYNSIVEQFNAAVRAFDEGNGEHPGRPPGKFDNPSGETKAQAKAILKRAREQLHTSGAEAKAKLDAAGNVAPPLPPADKQADILKQVANRSTYETVRHGASGAVDSLNSTVQAGLTHGHPTALAAGELTAVAIAELADGTPPAALPALLREHCRSERERYRHEWLGELWRHENASDPTSFIAAGWDECHAALDRVDTALRNPAPATDPCLATGQGWVAEEALAAALHCYLLFPEHPVAVLARAATTAGDSDSIACIAGAMTGAAGGNSIWPAEWAHRIEYTDQLADLGTWFDQRISD